MSKDDVSLDDELLQVTEKKTTKAHKKSTKDSPKGEEEIEEEEEGEVEEQEEGISDGSEHKTTKRKKEKGEKNSDNKKPLKKRKTSDSEDSLDDVYDDGWGDDLMGDDKDREMLAALPELEREAILDERYSQRKERREGWEIERRLKAEQRANREREKKESRKDSSRRESKESKDREKRDRGVKKSDSKGKALSELKKKRAKAGYKKSADFEDAEEGEVEVEESKDDDDDDYSPKKTASPERNAGKAKEDEEEVEYEEEDPGHAITFGEIEQLRLSRETLEKWVDKPFFDDLILGFFVRIGIGMDPLSRMNVYRVAQVKSVVYKQSYNLLGKPTTKWLKLLIGDKEKDFKMETISNRPFTNSEFEHWKLQMIRAKQSLPNSNEIPRMLQTLASAKDYRYTSDDINKMLEKKKQAGVLPIKVASEKARLALLRDAETDPEAKAKLIEQINRLEEVAKERANKRTPSSSVLNINQRNKEYNFITTLESKGEEKANSDLDPFSRRRTLPRIVYASKHKEDSENGDSTNDHNNNNDLNNKINTTTNGSNSALKTSAGAPPPGKTSEHDSIDIDIPAIVPSTSPPPFSRPLSSTPTPTTPPFVPPEKEQQKTKSTLSLTDYMRRRRALE